MKQMMPFVLMLGLLTGGLQAQSWSAEQQEVWNNVETYWGLDTDRDWEGFLRYFHSDFLGWSNSDALPRTKESMRKWLTVDRTQTLAHEIKPVGIKIHGDVAIVHYYYALLVKDADGSERNVAGRWTDILKKDGTRWVLIADHGGTPADD